MSGLCPGCAHVRVIESAAGSRFLMCGKAKVDERFAKYPPQPVVRCKGYEEASTSKERDS